MRNLLLIAVAVLANTLAAEAVEMEVVGHTANYQTAEPVGNLTFSTSPELRWYTYDDYYYNTITHTMPAEVTLTGGASDAGGLFNLKVKVEMPAEEDRPKSAYGENLTLHVTLMFKGGEYAGMEALPLSPGKKIAKILYVEACSVTGIATGDDGKPLANKDLTLVSDKGQLLDNFGGKTNDKGEFTVYAPYGGYYDLRCGDLVVAAGYSGGWATDSAYFAGGAYGTRTLGTVRFTASGTLKFSVLSSMPEYSYVAFVGPSSEKNKRRISVNKGASFDGKIAAGKYTLEVARASGWDHKTTSSEFEVKAGETTDLGDLGALPGEKRIWIDLKLSKEGADASRAYISLIDEKGYSVYAKWNATDSRWEFVLVLESARTLTARVDLEGFGPFSGKLEIAPEAESVEIALQPLSYINASAEDENGDYMYATLYAVAHDTDAHAALLKGFTEFREWRDDNYYDYYLKGATELYASYSTKIAPGKYTVVALVSPATESMSKEIDVPAGETVTIRLSANAQEVKMTFTRNGEPLAEREVVLLRPSDYDPWIAFGAGRMTDAQGSITAGMRAGRFSAKLPTEDLWNATVVKEIEARAFEIKADTTELTVDLTPKFSSIVQVEVIGSDQEQITSIEVVSVAKWRSTRAGYGYDTVREYTQGGVEYGSLEPGAYRAVCYCGNWTYTRPSYVAEFTVTGSGVQKFKLTPKRRVLTGQAKVEGAQKLPPDSRLEWYYISTDYWSQPSVWGGTVELDEQGNFEFIDPPLSDIVIGGFAGDARGSRVVRAQIDPTTADLSLTPRLGDLVVRIKAPYQTDYEFALRDAAGIEYTPAASQVWQRLGADSAAVLAELPAGKFDLVIRSAGCLTHVIKDVQVSEGKTALVEAKLEAAAYSRWRVQMPEGVELDAAGVKVEFLDGSGKTISEWSSASLSASTNIRLDPGWSTGEYELSVYVTETAAKSVRISATGCKPITIATKDFPEDFYNEWGELQALEFQAK